MICLDTSAVIKLLRGEDAPLALADESVGLSSIVVMELHTGVFHGGGAKERKRVQEFLQAVEQFTFDESAAMAAAKVRADLWSQGTPIGDYDVLIAAHAIALGLNLLTDNVRHFERVDGLQVIPWRS